MVKYNTIFQIKNKTFCLIIVSEQQEAKKLNVSTYIFNVATYNISIQTLNVSTYKTIFYKLV